MHVYMYMYVHINVHINIYVYLCIYCACMYFFLSSDPKAEIVVLCFYTILVVKETSSMLIM